MNSELLYTFPAMQESFRCQSIEALKQNLADGSYPGYPTERLSNENGGRRRSPVGRYNLPLGPWHIPLEDGSPPDGWIPGDQAIHHQSMGYHLDYYNRPVHPWIDDMLADPDIGVVTGKGAYWNYGPNYTADPLIFRFDKKEPELLLIQRADTHQMALPGGFVDEGEKPLDAAIREAWEETAIAGQFDIRSYLGKCSIRKIYSGPLADLRVTANAWPETTAYSFVLMNDLITGLPPDTWLPDSEEVEMAGWFPVSGLDQHLRFGSHHLLARLVVGWL